MFYIVKVYEGGQIYEYEYGLLEHARQHIHFILTPFLEQSQSAFITLHCLGSELLAVTIDHVLVDLPVEFQS